MNHLVHACPPLGHGLTPCCNSTPLSLPVDDELTSDPAQVTCSDQEPPDSAARLMRTLRVVHRQCGEWARPGGNAPRDRALTRAAAVLLELIDHMAPAVSDDDQEQRDLTPTLHDRIAAVLLTTVRAGVPAAPGLRLPHGDGGHVFDEECAMCTGDIDSLADAVVRAFTAVPATEGSR